MALLLVLVLIVMVTAAGIFAAQSTAFEIRSSGFFRQAAQTHYITESGVVASLDEMKTYCSAYLTVMRQRQSAATMTPPGLAEPPLAYPFYLDDFNSRVLPGSIFAMSTLAGGARTEGSLGPTALHPNFRTEATVLAEQSTPQFGFGVGGGRDFYVPKLAIQFESAGETILEGTTNRAANVGGNVQAQEQLRMLATVPCL
jgi:hypothetical protein